VFEFETLLFDFERRRREICRNAIGQMDDIDDVQLVVLHAPRFFVEGNGFEHGVRDPPMPDLLSTDGSKIQGDSWA